MTSPTCIHPPQVRLRLESEHIEAIFVSLQGQVVPPLNQSEPENHAGTGTSVSGYWIGTTRHPFSMPHANPRAFGQPGLRQVAAAKVKSSAAGIKNPAPLGDSPKVFFLRFNETLSEGFFVTMALFT